MKSIKYTAVALALIAAASFTSSAKAQTAGDIILGLYDANSSGTGTVVPNSYELDLGSFSSLTPGETFNLGSSISSEFSSDSAASLVFNIAGSGATGAGGLSAKETAFTASSLPTLPQHGGNTTENANLQNEIGLFNEGTALTLGSSTSSTGTSISGISLANSNSGSFDTVINDNSGSYGYAGNALLSAYPASGAVDFYTVTNSNSQESAVLDGTFVFGGTASDTTLTFSPVATPEPSAYALGLCAVALFWVLNRRRSVS
jgi:hypothetical protein